MIHTENLKEESYTDSSTISAAAKKIKELGEGKTCFFCTTSEMKDAARPMSVLKVDDAGNVWFLSASDSTQNRDIEAEPMVNLYFQGIGQLEFMHLYGKAVIFKDKKFIKELWQPVLKNWFPEGDSDPRIRVIKVIPEQVYYWDNKHGAVTVGAKILLGTGAGKVVDFIEGQFKSENIHRPRISHG